MMYSSPVNFDLCLGYSTNALQVLCIMVLDGYPSMFVRAVALRSYDLFTPLA